jgi:hypothetical protein
MRRLLPVLTILLFGLSSFCYAAGDDEISLFDSTGTATAYIAEELTIYLWSGKPVAYLEKDGAGGFHIYGFNGKHLGWFVGGIARDHKGKAVGAVKEAFATGTKTEPFKSFKQFKPFKSFKEFAPFRPFFSNDWSDTSFKLFLLQGASN